VPTPEGMRTLLSALLILSLAAVLAVPASAAPNALANGEAEGMRQAVNELWQAKAAAKPAQAALLAQATRSMGKCRTKGKGWKRLRKIKDGAQRRLYASGARILWKELFALAQERARLQPLRGAMGSYVNRIESAGVKDPVLVAGVAAQRRRLGIQEVLVKDGTCKVFEARMRKVHAIKRKGQAQAHFDSAAGAIYGKLARYISKKRIVASRQYESELEAAFDRLVELGMKEGDANGFLYALSLAR
jgi:hypothetical protein